jgi:hypothetical protein
MSEETCPECGREGLLFCAGVIQCPHCEYSRILDPCTGCRLVLTCMVDCREKTRFQQNHPRRNNYEN